MNDQPGTRAAATCVLCADRGRSTPLAGGRVCPACAVRIRDHLADIGRLADIAAASLQPAHRPGNGRTIPGSRPPIRLDAVDPELAGVDIAGDGTRIPLLLVLEEWERTLRAARGWTPYGPASLHAATTPPSSPATPPGTAGACTGTRATLHAVLDALSRSLDWVLDQDDWPHADMAAEIAACRRALTRWDPTREHRPGWRVPCPTLRDDGHDCARPLHVDPADTRLVHCHGCHRDWDPARLLRVAGRDADAYVDLAAAVAGSAVPARTIQRWAKDGHVRRRYGRYSLRDIRRHATTPD